MSFYTVSHRTHMSCIGSHVICCRHILPPWIGIKAFFLKIHGTRKARAHSGELSPHCWHRPATHATRPVAGVRHLPACARTAVPLHRSTADAAVQRDSLPLTCGLYNIFFLQQISYSQQPNRVYVSVGRVPRRCRGGSSGSCSPCCRRCGVARSCSPTRVE